MPFGLMALDAALLRIVMLVAWAIVVVTVILHGDYLLISYFVDFVTDWCVRK